MQLPSPSGPRLARIYLALLALNALVAWLSLGWQVRLLYGSRGLLPMAPLVARLREAEDGPGFLELPSLLWLDASDTTLLGLCGLGGALSLAALLRRSLAPLLLPLSALLYLSFVSLGQDFLSFQWDNLLVEAGLLAGLLSSRTPAPLAHWLHRILLFKLFFESGLAKAQSSIGDWWDGSAMHAYYETAPIPTALAWPAHHLPGPWHSFESWWTLTFELVLALGIFGNRTTRLVALAAFWGFLVLDMATANYGFFVTITAALTLFLLDETDLGRLDALVKPWTGRPAPTAVLPPPHPARGLLTLPLALLWVGLSLQVALTRFAGVELLPALADRARPWRVANAYHLFGAITTERIEPDFQTRDAAGDWTSLPLHYKPGPLDRAPPFVAPHQPRVDFRLWFYGLSWQRGTPAYVQAIVQKLCEAPEDLSSLFAVPLDRQAEAVRLVFWRYELSDWGQEGWWTATEVGRSREVDCP